MILSSSSPARGHMTSGHCHGRTRAARALTPHDGTRSSLGPKSGRQRSQMKRAKSCQIEEPGLPEIPCVCASVRRAARLVTQLYDEEFRPGLQASQFALLSAIEAWPSCNQSTLASMLAVDKTTLSRNLGLLQKQGWIDRASVGDSLDRRIRLTKLGQRTLNQAKPDWERAQKRLRSSMTVAQWEAMWKALRDLTEATRQARNRPRRPK
jgi:DNA-binding MarR family transcriptional regulator